MTHITRRFVLGAALSLALVLAGGPAARAFEASAAPRFAFIPAATAPDRARRVFQGIPTIEFAGGRLWSAFYGDASQPQEGPGNYVILRRSDDRGRSWTEVGYVAADDGQGRAIDPELWRDPDGALWLFFATTRGAPDRRYGVSALVIEHPDQDPAEAKVFPLADFGVPGKPVVAGGRILMPIDLRESPRSPLYPDGTGKWVFQLDHKRRTLTRLGKIPDTPDILSYQETSLVPLDDGGMLAIFRTQAGQYVSRSQGGDVTRWSPPEPWSALPPNPQSRARVRRMPDGTIAVAFNDDPGKRRRMTLGISTDGGRTLARTVVLTGGGSSYPDITSDGRGNIVVVWDSGRSTKREIAGAFVSEKAMNDDEARPKRFVVDRQSVLNGEDAR